MVSARDVSSYICKRLCSLTELFEGTSGYVYSTVTSGASSLASLSRAVDPFAAQQSDRPRQKEAKYKLGESVMSGEVTDGILVLASAFDSISALQRIEWILKNN